jgi:hypothetical protein
MGLFGVTVCCYGISRSVGSVSSGGYWALNINDDQTWAQVCWSELAGIASLIAAAWLVLPGRLLLLALGLFLLAQTFWAVESCLAFRSDLVVPPKLADAGLRIEIAEANSRRPLSGQRGATAGVAGLRMLEAFGLAALASCRQRGFSFRRIGRCLGAILICGGLTAIPGFFLWFVSVFALGFGGEKSRDVLIGVSVAIVAGIAAGALTGLWLLERGAADSRFPGGWGTALAGLASGIGVSWFSAWVMDTSDHGSLEFFILVCLSIAMGTIAGYSLGGWKFPRFGPGLG